MLPTCIHPLRDHNAALCLPIGWGIPLDIQITADWTYLRFHGGAHSIVFEDDELTPWAARIRELAGAGRRLLRLLQQRHALEAAAPPAIDNASACAC